MELRNYKYFIKEITINEIIIRKDEQSTTNLRTGIGIEEAIAPLK